MSLGRRNAADMREHLSSRHSEEETAEVKTVVLFIKLKNCIVFNLKTNCMDVVFHSLIT